METTPDIQKQRGPSVVNTAFHFGPPEKHDRAFSLIELIIVLVIVAAVSTIAIPRYANSHARYRVESAARRIAADLTYTRSVARSTSSAAAVVFNLGTETYTIPEVTPLDGGPGVYTVNLVAEPYLSTLDTANFGGTPIANFDGYGTPLNGGSVTVTAGGLTETIVLDADTGVAAVQ